MRWVCNKHGETRNVYKTLVENPHGKPSLGSPRCGWKILMLIFGKQVVEVRSERN
jgi:hypothetical protein